MTTRGRFAAAWALATVPPFLIGDLLLDKTLSWIYEIVQVSYWTPVLPYYLAIVALAAWLQSRVLERHQRAVTGWVPAALLGHLAAALVFLSAKSQWTSFLDSFGSVRLPTWWFYTFSGTVTLSVSFCIAAAEAWALRKPGLGPRWPLWILGRTGLALSMLAGLLALGYFPLGPVAGFTYWETFLGILAGAGAWHTVSAGATAWMLDVLVFREPGTKLPD